jgi:hypothetical protein
VQTLGPGTNIAPSTHLSFVSCDPWCSGFMTWSLYNDDKILATAGLQISHPTDPFAPTVSMMDRKSRRRLILTTWKRSMRDILKCGHRLAHISTNSKKGAEAHARGCAICRLRAVVMRHLLTG